MLDITLDDTGPFAAGDSIILRVTDDSTVFQVDAEF